MSSCRLPPLKRGRRLCRRSGRVPLSVKLARHPTGVIGVIGGAVGAGRARRGEVSQAWSRSKHAFQHCPKALVRSDLWKAGSGDRPKGVEARRACFTIGSPLSYPPRLATDETARGSPSERPRHVTPPGATLYYIVSGIGARQTRSVRVTWFALDSPLEGAVYCELVSEVQN
jgi:hypothetical protein